MQTSAGKVGCEAPTEAAEDLLGEDDDADMTDAEDAPPATEADNTHEDAAGDIEAAVTSATQELVQVLLHQHSSFADLCTSILSITCLLIQSAAFSSVLMMLPFCQDAIPLHSSIWHSEPVSSTVIGV